MIAVDNTSSTPLPAVVLGAAGYVGGELLRILGAHDGFAVTALSRSHAGEPVVATFPHLAPLWGRTPFLAPSELGALLETHETVALFSALPHGAAAEGLAEAEAVAEESGATLKIVDLSADFRLADDEAWLCALPDITKELPVGVHVANPGCFTTAVSLATKPLVALGLVEPRVVASCVTGSTGSGAAPKAATHHPWRHGNLKAYSPLVHRHTDEMRRLTGNDDIVFLPHSGPFARGIHATISARLVDPMSTADVAGAVAGFYEHTPFVQVGTEPPTLKDVVGTNHAKLGIAVEGREVVVFSVIDNLVKGAAGGAVQWMNRLCGLPESAGLTMPGLGWS